MQKDISNTLARMVSLKQRAGTTDKFYEVMEVGLYGSLIFYLSVDFVTVYVITCQPELRF